MWRVASAMCAVSCWRQRIDEVRTGAGGEGGSGRCEEYLQAGLDT
jgi:hypothetical protein